MMIQYGVDIKKAIRFKEKKSSRGSISTKISKYFSKIAEDKVRHEYYMLNLRGLYTPIY